MVFTFATRPEAGQAMKLMGEQRDASHPFQLQRLGVVMEPEPGNPLEAEGVLNPASARGRDGHLYLFPRLGAHLPTDAINTTE